uniref:Alternative protein MLH1 n=1 Tax=Homo sapiens TaxID=9606 RepID=L8E8C0_HUMAN|nr:alternative protein MLH1 [Homo sapiens]
MWMLMCTPQSMKFTSCTRRASWSGCSSTSRASSWAPIPPGCTSPRLCYQDLLAPLGRWLNPQQV